MSAINTTGTADTAIGTAEVYQKHKLAQSKKCIRVLEIAASPNVKSKDKTNRVRCSFKVIDLDETPCFTALSYVWGKDPPGQYSITCDGVRIPVTRSCESALHHMQRKFGQLKIWVDAVCINQSDLGEKAQQIPLMGEIYSRADHVYIWLGDGTRGTDRAMGYIADNVFEKNFLRGKPFAAARTICLAPWNLFSAPLPLPSSKPWMRWTDYTKIDDISELLGSLWITRVWTYQELLFASNPIVICGDHHASWSQFELSLEIFAQLNRLERTSISWRNAALGRSHFQLSSPMTRPATLTDDRGFKKYTERVWRARGWIELGSTMFGMVSAACCLSGIFASFYLRHYAVGIALVCIVVVSIIILLIPPAFGYTMRTPEVLIKIRRSVPPATNNFIDALYTRTATNPKDMAYGLWAVLEKQSSRKFEPPNYDYDVGRIYRDFTIQVMTVTASVESLLYAASCSIDGQPSWIPDWAACRQNQWKASFTTKLVTDDYGNNIGTADQNSLARFSIDETTLVIAVQAYRVATISCCARLRRTSGEFNSDERDVHLENLRWLDMQQTMEEMSAGYFVDGPWDRFRAKRDVFLCWRGNKSPQQTLAALENLASTGDPEGIVAAYFKGFLSMKLERKVGFIAPYAHPNLMPECSGLCSAGRVEVGDFIIRVQGLKQLLLVRLCGDSGRKVRIQSPVLLNAFSEKQQKLFAKCHKIPRIYEDWYIQ